LKKGLYLVCKVEERERMKEKKIKKGEEKA